MSEMSLEKTHALLEKLAEYVMTQVPTRQDMNERFEQVDKHFEQINHELLDIRSELGLIRAEQRVFAQSFELHHKRLERLEERSTGYNRVRDEKDKKDV